MLTETAAGAPRRRTRDRVLEAAMARFAQHSYEATRLRDIAADIGIDVALVHRSFGSKEELFMQALKASLGNRFAHILEAPDVVAAMVAHFAERGTDRPTADPLDLAVHSLSSEQANPVLRAFVQEELLAPLAARLGPGHDRSVAVLLACIAGISILRDVLGIEILRDVRPEALRSLLEGTLQAGFDREGATEARPALAATALAAGSGPSDEVAP